MTDFEKRLASLTPEKRALLTLRLKQKQAETTKKDTIPRRADLDAFPLSFAQQRLWFLDQLEAGSPLYTIAAALRLRGALDVAALERGLNEIVRRHEVLRARFVTAKGRPVQVIAPVGSFRETPLPVADLRGLPAAEREDEALRRATEEAQRPFDLASGPLLRASLIQLGDADWIMVLTMHHIIADGWSTGVLVREIAALYDAFAHDRPSPLPDLALQYADFAAWQRHWLHDEGERGESPLQQQLRYWKQQLGDSSFLLELPTDRPRPAVQTFHGAHHGFMLPAPLAERLKALGQQEEATLFMTLLAAFQTLLYRYTGQEDINVGSPIANRNRGEIEGLIGLFINTLVLRGDLSGDPSFRQLLRRVREVTLGAYAHQDVPFEMLVEELHPQRDMSRTPLFQAMLVLQTAAPQLLKLPGVTLELIDTETGTAKFDLLLQLEEGPDGLKCTLEYNTDLFEAATIARMAGHFERLLEGVARDLDSRVSRLPLLSAEERGQALGEHIIPRAFPTQSCLHQFVEQQAARNPTALALTYERHSLTYHELNARANQLAHQLQQLGVGPEVIVGVCLERSLELVVALLGVLKAGAAYLPLDPAYPAERRAFLLQDAQAAVLLTTTTDHRPPTTEDRGLRIEDSHAGANQKLSSILYPLSSTTLVVYLDTDWEQIAQQPATNPVSAVRVENLAYVIYTSGSTGQPKGVQVSHANVVRLLAASEEWFGFGADDVWTLFHSAAFDFSVWELWGALAYGGRLVVVPYLTSRSPQAFYQMLAEERVTVLNQTPSAFRQLMRAEQTATERRELALRYVIFGGEALELSSLRPWFEHHGDERPRLVNMYGITETTVHVTYRPVRWADVQGGLGSRIGEGIPDLQVYVLDRQMQPAPLGVAGELYVGGAGLARGYLNRPELTAQRFVPNPFGENREPRTENREPRTDDGLALSVIGGRWSVVGGRLYKTGDKARLLPTGDIEYLGRLDQQVKLRGFRIELGEIAAALSEHERVGEAVVELREDRPGEKRLVAYVVPTTDDRPFDFAQGRRPTTDHHDTVTRRQADKVTVGAEGSEITPSPLHPFTPSSQELRAYLKQRLPEYMVPSAFVVLQSLPLTSNGKLDRKALPPPDGARPELTESYAAPRTPEEETLASIWAQVLGVKQVGIHDNFFELGGDSILSIQVIARANQAGLRLTPRQLFLSPTVAGMAAVAGTAQSIQAEQGAIEGPAPLTPIQRWFFEQEQPDPHHYNQALLLEARVRVERPLLEAALQHLLAHHDALRLRFTRAETGWAQANAGLSEAAPPVGWVELSALAEAEQRAAIEAAAAQAQAQLDLGDGPLVRMIYFDLGAERPGRLLLVIHHLAIDAVSWRVLLEDFQTVYLQLSRGEPVRLPQKTTSFQHWSERLSAYAQSEAVRAELDGWVAAAEAQPARLAVDTPGGANREDSARGVVVSLDEEETRALLQDVPAAYGTEINDALLTALAQSLARWTGAPELLVDLEGHGREDLFDDVDLTRTVGWFTTLFPVRLDLRAAHGPGEALKTAKEQLRRIPARGIGYGLLRYLSADEAVRARLAALPRPEVSFNYLGQFDAMIAEATAFGPAAESSGPAHSPRGSRTHILSINGGIADGRLRMEWGYSANLYRQETVERMAREFVEALRALIAHCQAPDAVGYTPSDFPDADLSQDDLDALLAEIGEA